MTDTTIGVFSIQHVITFVLETNGWVGLQSRLDEVKAVFNAGQALADAVELGGVMVGDFLKLAQPELDIAQIFAELRLEIPEFVPELLQVPQRQWRDFFLCFFFHTPL